MTHVRAALRSVLQSTLSGSTAAGTNVFVHPFNPRRSFPALVIEDLGANHSDGNITETISLLTTLGEVHLQRTYRVCVIAEVQQVADSDVERDDLCAEVEAAIEDAWAAGDFGKVLRVTPVAYIASDDNSGDTKVRRGLTVFEFVFITSQGNPSTLL